MGMIDCRISHEGARVGLAPAEIDSTPEASANGSIASDQLDLHGQHWCGGPAWAGRPSRPWFRVVDDLVLFRVFA